MLYYPRLLLEKIWQGGIYDAGDSEELGDDFQLVSGQGDEPELRVDPGGGGDTGWAGMQGGQSGEGADQGRAVKAAGRGFHVNT